MLPKKSRTDKKAIERVFKEGKFINFPHLTFKFIQTRSSVSPRISFIVPKSIAKLAVKRNKLRRRGYDVLKTYITDFPLGLIGVFIFKKYQDDISIIKDEIKTILSKIN